MHIEYDTLIEDSHRSPPSCFGCGAELYDLDFKFSNDGRASFLYVVKGKQGSHDAKVASQFCSQSCQEHYEELQRAMDQVDEAAPQPIIDTGGLFGRGDVDMQQEGYLQREIIHFGAKLMVDEQSGHAKAGEAISCGAVLFNLHGQVLHADQGKAASPSNSPSMSKIDLEPVVDKPFVLVVEPRSLARHVDWSSDIAQCNAELVAQYSLLRAVGSPWKKSAIVSAGAFVVVAEKQINRGEKIVVHLPAAVEADGTVLAPAPIDAMTLGRKPAQQAEDGIQRLPADVPVVDEEEEEAASAALPPKQLQRSNAKRQGASFAVDKLIELAPSPLKEALKAYAAEADSTALRLLVDSMVVCHGRVVFVKDIGGDGIKAALKEIESKRARGAPPLAQGSEDEVSEKDFETFEKANPQFDPCSADFKLGPMWDTSLSAQSDRNSQSPSKIVNLSFLKQHFHACLTSKKCRIAEMKKLATEKVDVKLAQHTFDCVAMALSSDLFNTKPLDDDTYRASSGCLAVWARTVEAMLKDSNMHNKLKLAKELLAEKKVKFYPSVVLKSLDALLYDLEIRQGKTSFLKHI
jgi:hypothetical protein